MDLTAIDPVWWIVTGVVVALVVIGVLVWRWRRTSTRRDRLRRRFGPEYERVRESGRRQSAESDLERRLDRRDGLQLADLADADVDDLEEQIAELVPEFVWRPEESAREMSRITERVAVARGYVATDQGVLDLVSVDHPESVSHLRHALDDMERGTGQAAQTEACRQVFLEARALAYQLVDDSRGIDPRYSSGGLEGVRHDDEAVTDAPPSDPDGPEPHADADLDREPDTLRDTHQHPSTDPDRR